MKQLKCPNCGSTFTVDEAEYASILSQVKTAEFNDEVRRRVHELQEQQKAQQALSTKDTPHVMDISLLS